MLQGPRAWACVPAGATSVDEGCDLVPEAYLIGEDPRLGNCGSEEPTEENAGKQSEEERCCSVARRL